MIPLRPELIEFMSLESMGRMQSCSKALRRDLRDMNAWQLLAAAQCPKESTRDILERDAISRVRSQALRRQLADNLCRARAPIPTPNSFTDFTYFLRIEDGDVLIWEGDLGASPLASGNHYFRLDPSPLLARMNSWDRMIEYLSRVPGDDPEDESFMERLLISIVAVREADSAMISLGCFLYQWVNEAEMGESKWNCQFLAQEPIFNTPKNFCVYPVLTLNHTHDSDGSGALNFLELHMSIYYKAGNSLMHCDILTRERMQFVLTYLAGAHHLNRSDMRRVIDEWYDNQEEEDVFE